MHMKQVYNRWKNGKYIYILVLEYIRLQTITEYSGTTETQHVTRVTLQF